MATKGGMQASARWRQERRHDHLVSTREVDGAARHLRALRPRYAAAVRAAPSLAAMRIVRSRDHRMDNWRGWLTSPDGPAVAPTNRDAPCRMTIRSCYSSTIMRITERCMQSICSLAAFASFHAPTA